MTIATAARSASLVSNTKTLPQEIIFADGLRVPGVIRLVFPEAVSKKNGKVPIFGKNNKKGKVPVFRAKDEEEEREYRIPEPAGLF